VGINAAADTFAALQLLLSKSFFFCSNLGFSDSNFFFYFPSFFFFFSSL